MARSRFPFFLAFVGPSGFFPGVFFFSPTSRSQGGGRKCRNGDVEGGGNGRRRGRGEKSMQRFTISAWINASFHSHFRKIIPFVMFWGVRCRAHMLSCGFQQTNNDNFHEFLLWYIKVFLRRSRPRKRKLGEPLQCKKLTHCRLSSH